MRAPEPEAAPAGLTRRNLLAAGTAATVGAMLVAEPAAAAAARPAPPGQPAGRPRLLFHVLSDVHMNAADPQNRHDMAVAMQDLHRCAPNADALVIIGDLTEYGRPEEYQKLRQTLDQNPHPKKTYLTIGNHEYFGKNGVAVDRQRYLDFVGRRRVYYDEVVKGYRFVILGGEDVLPAEYNSTKMPWTAVLSDAQLDWLEQTLARDRGTRRPTFLFLHQPANDVAQRDRLERILRANPHVIYFSGHWHVHLRHADPRLFGNGDGYWRVSAGATTYLWDYKIVDGEQKQIFRADWKQGLQIEVYDDRIAVRGRDFLTEEWIAEFQHTIPIPPA